MEDMQIRLVVFVVSFVVLGLGFGGTLVSLRGSRRARGLPGFRRCLAFPLTRGCSLLKIQNLFVGEFAVVDAAGIGTLRVLMRLGSRPRLRGLGRKGLWTGACLRSRQATLQGALSGSRFDFPSSRGGVGARRAAVRGKRRVRPVVDAARKEFARFARRAGGRP